MVAHTKERSGGALPPIGKMVSMANKIPKTPLGMAAAAGKLANKAASGKLGVPPAMKSAMGKLGPKGPGGVQGAKAAFSLKKPGQGAPGRPASPSGAASAAAAPMGMGGPAPIAYLGLIAAPGPMGGPGGMLMGGPGGAAAGPGGAGDEAGGAGAGQPSVTGDSLDAAFQASAAAAAARGANQGPRLPPGLSEAFLLIYKLTTIFAAMVFALMVVYGVLDVLAYVKNEVAQRVQRTRDPNMFNKDTTDIKALRYIQTNNPDDEPYHIFQQQQLVGYLFVIAGIMIIFLGIQLGTFFSLKIFAVFTQREFKEQVEVPTRLLAAMVVMMVAAVLIKGLYRKHFIRRVQASLRDLRSQLRDIRTFMYNNFSTNSTFLAALRSDNIDDVVETMKAVLTAKDANACMDKMSPCDGDVESMLFTLNIYSYLRMQVPDSDPNYDKIRLMFDVDGINSRSVDPTMYFYYKQPTYIPNLYPVLRKSLKKYFGTPTGKPAPNDYTENTVRERIFLVNVSNKMQDLNSKLSRMYNLATGKNKVRGYLFTYLLYVSLFAAILIGMFFTEAKPYLLMVWAAWERFWGFTKDKAEAAVKFGLGRII
jgi:hypothetical protein